MSTIASGSQHGDDHLVDAMMNFCSDIFASCFILDPDVQRLTAKNLLASGKFVDYAGHKFDMLAEASQQFSVEAKSQDPFAMARQVIHIRAGLTAVEKTHLTSCNQDVELRFTDTTIMPHGVTYAQRIIDTQRCIALIDHKDGKVLDIGGNYATHALSQRKINFHCCTKLEGELEWHRQVQRSVNLYYADQEGADYCTEGAEKCFVSARSGICIHTMPNIDPDLWPQIFKNHDLEVVISIFHYDVTLETDTVGFITDANMHWHVKDDGFVHFHFENDSSHGYDHRHDWLVKYGSNWMATMPDWDYVVYYQVDFIEAGRAQATLTRLEKSTLGVQEVMPLYRYIETEDMAELMVPKFDPDLGYSIRDPRAYVTVPVRTPMAVLAYLYKFGIANDKQNPDMPLTADEMRIHAHAFNHVRKINGTDITIPDKQSHAIIDDVAVGAYLLIVKRVAMNKVLYGTYTDHMMSLQRRWGEESTLMLFAKCFSYAAISPFILMAGSMSDVVDLVAMHMRNTISASKVVASMQEVLPYRRLSPMRPVNANASAVFSMGTHVLSNPEDVDVQVDLPGFYDIFKDTMSPEQRKRVEEYIKESTQDDKLMPDPEQALPEIKPHLELPFPEDRERWIAAYQTFDQEIETVELPPRLVPETTLEERVNPSKVWEHYSARVYEYALSMSDEGLHMLSNAEEACRNTWAGDNPNFANVNSENIQYDTGVVYYRVVDGLIRDMDASEPYAIVLDPMNRTQHSVFVRDGECRVIGVTGNYVFVCESFRIFNNFKLGRIAHAAAAVMGEPAPVPAILNDGVPGCGKTHMILEEFTIKDVIVVTVKSTAMSILAKLIEDERFKGREKTLTQRVRTADSANMHTVPVANTLFVDEGLMLHSGALTLALYKTHASKLRVFGDTEQIGFISRGTPLGNLHFESLFYWTQIIENNVSARMPGDACYVSAKFYDKARQPHIKTYNPIMRSITVKYIPDVKSPEYTEPKAPYVNVCVLRVDRGKLVGLPGFVDGKKKMTSFDDPVRPVLSVHEVQGETYPFVRLFRMNIYNAKVFSSSAHMNVAFTRHLMKLEILSPCLAKDDGVVKAAEEAIAAPDEDIRAHMLPAPQWVLDRHMKLEQQFAKYLGA